MTERHLSDAPVAPSKLAHVVLRTAHYEDATRWYCDVLAARVVFQSSFLTFLTYDEEHHRIALLNTEGAPPPERGATGVDHVAFTFADIGDLLATYRRLMARDVAPFWSINHGPTTSLYYRDPDGNQIELQVDNFDTPDAFADWARSGAFTRNPIGVEFDPEDLCRRYLAGESEDSLRRQPVTP